MIKIKLWKFSNYIAFIFLFLLIIAVWVYFYFDKFWNKKEVPNNLELSKSLSSNNILDNQKKIPLPDRFNWCKSDLNFYWCLINTDKEWKKIDISKELLQKNVDELSNYKDWFDIQSQQVVKILWMEIKNKYINTNPKFVLESDSCNTEFCKQVFLESKKNMLDVLKFRRLITNSSFCAKLADLELQKHCEKMF